MVGNPAQRGSDSRGSPFLCSLSFGEAKESERLPGRPRLVTTEEKRKSMNNPAAGREKLPPLPNPRPHSRPPRQPQPSKHPPQPPPQPRQQPHRQQQEH